MSKMLELSPVYIFPEAPEVDDGSRWAAPEQSELVRTDAHFHYFFGDVGSMPNEGSVCSESTKNSIAKSILDVLKDNPYKVVNCLYEDDLVSFSGVRDRTSFFTGMLANFVSHKIKYGIDEDRYLRNSTVVLDARDYRSEHPVGWVPETGFEKLADLIYRTDEVIEEGIIKTFDTATALRFIKGDKTANFLVTRAEDPDYTAALRKVWQIEGYWLDVELRKIPEFRKNFDNLVILNASKCIAKEEFNVNKLYKLFAQLGRKNTQIIFVG